MTEFDPQIGKILNSFWDISTRVRVHGGLFRPPLGFDASYIASLQPFKEALPDPDRYFEGMTGIIAVRLGVLPGEKLYAALLGQPSGRGMRGPTLSFAMSAADGHVLSCEIAAGIEDYAKTAVTKYTLLRVPMAILTAGDFPPEEGLYAAARMPQVESLVHAAGATIIDAAVHMQGPGAAEPA